MTELPDYVIQTPAQSQQRIGLIASPGAGKTTAALTWPNPIVLDFDRKCPPGVNAIPFYNPAVAKKFLLPSHKSAIDYSPRYALIDFLEKEGPKFSPDTTLIIDSWTSMMNQLDIWQETNKTALYWSDKKKDVDGYQLHGDRLTMGIEVAMTAKELPCNIIYLFHEQIERDKEGNALTSIKPVMKGQFADQFSLHLTAFFRVRHSPKWPTNNGYYFRVKADDAFKAVTPHKFQVPSEGAIDATYDAYIKQIKP